MARTLIQTMQDALTHAHAMQQALPAAPAHINTGKDAVLADQHHVLETLMQEIIYFVDRWSELTGEHAEVIDLDSPTEEEVQTAIQSITGGTP